MLDHREIVRDEEIGEAQPLAQVHEQVQHLRLDRHVEGGHRLVADDEGGFTASARRCRRAGAGPPENWWRIAASIAAVEADLVQHLANVCRLPAARHQPVHARRLAHDLRHAQPRVQRGVGVLEDHLHGELPDAAFLPAIAATSWPRQVMAPALCGQDAGDDAAERALAAARFAYQAHDFALGHVEIDVGHRLHDGLAHAGAEGVGDPAGDIDALDEALGDAAQGEDGGLRSWLLFGDMPIDKGAWRQNLDTQSDRRRMVAYVACDQHRVTSQGGGKKGRIARSGTGTGQGMATTATPATLDFLDQRIDLRRPQLQFPAPQDIGIFDQDFVAVHEVDHMMREKVDEHPRRAARRQQARHDDVRIQDQTNQ